MSKPRVLILGGIGFIGRNLVEYLVNGEHCSYIRVADKVLKQTANLGESHQAAFANEIVDFKQVNLCSDAGVAKAFDLEDGQFDIVVNLAAETKYGQSEEVYREKVLDLAVKCAAAAQSRGIRRWVEVSTAQIYAGGKRPSTEDDEIAPWTRLAQFKLQAEQHIREQSFEHVILRPAIVHGPGDISGLAPRIIVGAVYKRLGETQRNLWNKNLAMNTVHVADVCNAIWLGATSLPSGSVFNLADKSGTNQGAVNKFLEALFGIKTGFAGQLISGIAKTSLDSIAESANDKHLKPWSELCKEAQPPILNTPLSPYIDVELLYNNSMSINGSAIEEHGFQYQHPELTLDHFKDIVAYFVSQNLFPTGLVQ